MFRNSKIYSLHPCRDKLFINLGIIINILLLFVKIIYFCAINRKLCISTSGARMKHNVHGSLLTNAHLCEQTHSATARHEHAAQRNANGHRVKQEFVTLHIQQSLYKFHYLYRIQIHCKLIFLRHNQQVPLILFYLQLLT